MPILKVIITARAPLVFSERRPGGQFRQSAPFVPGSALRGALAQHLIDAGEKDSDVFASCFIGDDAPLFRNAYPSLQTADKSLQSRPLPATAYTCKADTGFDGHGIFDGLIDRLCRERLRVKVPYLPRCLNIAHDEGGDRVEALTGFYVNGSKGQKSASVRSHMTTRVAINRRRRVAETGLLYSPIVISEGGEEGPTMFCGSVVANDPCCKVVESCLPKLTHAGSGAARGFGRVAVQVERASEDDLGPRVIEFNAQIRDRGQLWERLPRELHESDRGLDGAWEDGSFFAVLLVSDAILRVGGWIPTVRLLEEMLGPAGDGATLVRCYASVDYRGGWNSAWGLPKDTEPVARMGGVYVYHTSKRADDPHLWRTLSDLEARGVGERRVEGFGQVRICDEFHLRIQEVPKR